MYCTKIKSIFLLFLFLLSHASEVDMNGGTKLSILEHSHIYLDKKSLTLQKIITQDLFTAYTQPYINIGMHSQVIWITFTLSNYSSKPAQKILILTSPMLEHITLYKEGSIESPIANGRASNSKEHTTLFYHFPTEVAARTSQKYYLKIYSDYTPVDFALLLEDEQIYLKEDMFQQLITVMLIGVIIALMLYSFLISLYTRDKSYLFYSIYLFALIYQQISYLGLTQIYLPLSFNTFDMQIPNFKGSFVLITSALFAMHFLKTQKHPLLNNIYIFFILLASFEMLLFILFHISSMYLLAITVLLYITFNLGAGIISYRKGNKQARLFILGFGIIFLSYMMVVADALGVTSIMQSFKNALIWGTALEALILSLAFADRYTILQQQKTEADQHILQESKVRERIIQAEVIKKTAELKHALNSKEMLLQEVHHRVKNNLQIILSIIRLQNDEISDISISKKLIALEHRVNAIAKTYTMLLETTDTNEIDMKAYIESLLTDISQTFNDSKKTITIKTDIQAIVPLKEAVYIGLIINELVTNAYKYAFDDHKGTISITLIQKKNHFLLTIKDNGKGYILRENNHTLGLKLIHTLVYHQLEGTIEQETNNHTQYIIKFVI